VKGVVINGELEISQNRKYVRNVNLRTGILLEKTIIKGRKEKMTDERKTEDLNSLVQLIESMELGVRELEIGVEKKNIEKIKKSKEEILKFQQEIKKIIG